MARRGRICEMKRKFEDYDYVILGVGGIGKTTLAYEVGKKISGSDEGTFIITCGAEMSRCTSMELSVKPIEHLRSWSSA